MTGIEKTIEICVSGKPLTAPDALAAGIIDAIVEGDLRSEAVSYANSMVNDATEVRGILNAAVAFRKKNMLSASSASLSEASQ